MSLRMIEMVVKDAGADDLAAMSDELNGLGIWREHPDDDHAVLRLLVPSEKAEGVIRVLESNFQASLGFRLVIFEVQATLPKPEAVDADADGDHRDGEPRKEEKDPARIACDELVQILSAGAVINRIFVITVVLSAVVAAIGLIRDDVAVIIGAMVIAPLLGPNMTLALATTLGDPKLARRALLVNATGLSIALLVSVAIGMIVRVDPGVSEVANRIEVSFSHIALALAAGSAGALAYTTGLSAAVVGVMVAVALLPPLATAGLLLGGGYPQLAMQAMLLTATNVVCINLAGVGTFLWQQVSPRHWWEAERAKRMVRIAGGIWIGMLGLLILLILLANS